MAGLLLRWDLLQKILFNTIFVSIPEEGFWVMFILIVTGDFGYLKSDMKEDRKITKTEVLKIVAISSTIAIILNVLRYMGAGFSIIFPVSIGIMFVSIVLVYRLWDYTDSLKQVAFALLGVMLGILIIAIAEFAYMPFVLYGIGGTLEEINNNVFLNFIASLPSVLIEYCILVFLLVRMGTTLRANIIKPIQKSRFLLSTTIITVIFNTAFMFIMVKVICYDRILLNLSLTSQVLIIIGVTMFPILNIAALLLSIYYNKNKEATRNKEKSEQLKILVNVAKSYAGKENYDNIMINLDYMEKIAQELYYDEEKEE